MSTVTGAALSIGGITALLTMTPIFRHYPTFAASWLSRPNIVIDYVDAVAFGVHLLGVHAFSRQIVWTLRPIERAVRFLGSITFAIYLFHRPIIQLLAIMNVGTPTSWSQRAYLLGVTVLIIVTAGWWCEQQKRTLQRALRRWATSPLQTSRP